MDDSCFDLLCIGNALVDVFANDGGLSLRYGIRDPVQHVSIKKLKNILAALGEKTLVSGGGAANVAKISGRLGAKVCFIGALGDDDFGRLFEKELASAGVKLLLHKKLSPTGIYLMLREESGQTRIAASPSAAYELSESDISGEEPKKARVVLVDGFMMDRLPLVRRILDTAHNCGASCAIDLSSVSIAREYATELADFAEKYPLILFMNEAEAEVFSGELKKERPEAELTHTLQRIFLELSLDQEPKEENNKLKQKFPVIVVTLGSQGAVCYSEGKTCRAETQEIDARVTTGAGDAFCAGFLGAWTQNKSICECAALGNEASRIVLDTIR